MTTKIFVIWDRIGDYHRARLKALGGLVGMDNLIAADLGGVDKLYAWENSTNTPYQHVQLSNKPVEKSDAFHRLRNFLRILNQTKIKMVCLSGYGRLEYLLFIIISRLYGKKVLIFAESWYGNNKVVNYVKGQFLKTFVHYFFVSGSRARNHFHQKLGIPLSRIRTGYSVVDNNHFSPHNPTTQPLNPSSTPQQLNPL
ncbi:MAG: hypothetical protein OEW75_17680, partial [Cyclobacteriaceae bacterium]|nr:hypothetical protein [Cyclobacteriaceae bacterium]